MKTLYVAKATATGSGRDGFVQSSDEALATKLSIPGELGGAGGPGTNPEQLFAAGYAACFHSALHRVARKERTPLDGSSVTAEVALGAHDQGFGLAVELVVHAPGVERSVAEALAAAAHQVCPYSNATRGNVDVVVRVA